MAPKNKEEEKTEEIVEMNSDEKTEKKRDNPLVRLDLDHITYAPLTKGAKGDASRTTILSDITTTVAPYQLTAWMGPSGSGKFDEPAFSCVFSILLISLLLCLQGKPV